MKNKNVKKILAIFMIALSLISVFIPVLTVSADTQAIFPITINEPYKFDGSVSILFKNVNNPGDGNFLVYSQDVNGENPVQYYNGLSASFINDNLADFQNFPDYRYGVMILTIITRNSSININGIDYVSDFAAGSGVESIHTLDYSPTYLTIGKSQNASISFNATQLYYFEIHIPVNLDAETAYNEGYNTGYDEGKTAGESIGFENGFNDGYAEGYEDALNASDSAALGKNLISDTLNAPVNALKSFVFYVGPNGFPVTLWSIFGTVIAASLFLLLLKRFAGG